jgi:hypothetical protein
MTHCRSTFDVRCSTFDVRFSELSSFAIKTPRMPQVRFQGASIGAAASNAFAAVRELFPIVLCGVP